MPYLGNEPAEAYSNIAYQDFGTQSGTTFTLDFPVGAPGELEVFVNNVRQEPSVAYTVSGTTLTMTGTVAASDDFYVVFQGKAQQTVTHPANTGLVATTGTFSGGVTMGGTLGVTGQTTFSGDVVGAVQEYFQVELTTLQDGLTDQTVNIVDFGGKGTVKYDTKSKFDSANDAYLLGSSDGVYLISFSIGIRSDAIGTEEIVDASAAVFAATDGSSFVAVHGAGERSVDQSGGRPGSVMLSGSFIYKSTTATTKVLLKTVVNTAGGSYEHSRTSSDNVNTGDSSFDTANCTFLSVVRIA